MKDSPEEALDLGSSTLFPEAASVSEKLPACLCTPVPSWDKLMDSSGRRAFALKAQTRLLVADDYSSEEHRRLLGKTERGWEPVCDA